MQNVFKNKREIAIQLMHLGGNIVFNLVAAKIHRTRNWLKIYNKYTVWGFDERRFNACNSGSFEKIAEHFFSFAI